MMRKLFSLLLIGISSVFLVACSLTERAPETTFEVAVSIPPYLEIVSDIVGEKGTVFSIVPAGFSPETYEPSPQEMKRLADADLVIFNGDFAYEEKIEQTLVENNPNQKIIHLHDQLTENELMPLVAHEHEESDQSEGDVHEGELLDPHTWLSPSLMVRQLPGIVIALKDVDEANTQYYVDNAVVVVNRLEELASSIHSKLDRHWGRTFVVYHPAYSYFADEYNLKQVYIEVEGKEPSASQLKDQLTAASEQRIGAIFLEKQFATRTAESVASELGVSVEYVDPLAENYYDSMQTFATQLEESF